MTTTVPDKPLDAAAAPWFGRPWEHRQAAIAGVGSLVACGVYAFAADRLAPQFTPTPVEFVGTASIKTPVVRAASVIRDTLGFDLQTRGDNFFSSFFYRFLNKSEEPENR